MKHDNENMHAYLQFMPANLKTIFENIIAKKIGTDHSRQNLDKVLKKAFIIAICKQSEQSTQLETEDATSIITQWAEGNQDTTWAIDQLDLLVGKLPESTQALYASRLQTASDAEKIILDGGPVPSLIASLKKPFDPNDPKNMKPTLLAERNALHMQIVTLLQPRLLQRRNAPSARAHPPFTVTSTNPPQIPERPSAKQHASVNPTNPDYLFLMLFGRPKTTLFTKTGDLREPLLKDEGDTQATSHSHK